MSFFDPVPPPEPDVPAPERVPWKGSGDDTVGVPVPLVVLLAKSEEAATILSGVVAYPTGFSLTIVRIVRMLHSPLLRHNGPRDRFLFGLEFSDGSRVIANRFGAPGPLASDSPRLFPNGGGGGGRKYSMNYWCEPLAPSGAMRVATRWDEANIQETIVEIDATPIRAAGIDAPPIWPEDVGFRGHSG